jgi:hypothetical protein
MTFSSSITSTRVVGVSAIGLDSAALEMRLD